MREPPTARRCAPSVEMRVAAAPRVGCVVNVALVVKEIAEPVAEVPNVKVVADGVVSTWYTVETVGLFVVIMPTLTKTKVLPIL